MKKTEEILKKWYNPLHGMGEIAELQITEAMKEYAKLVAKQTLENASENVKLVISNYKANNKGICGWVETELKDNLFIINDGTNIVASKSSITNPDNIPTI